MLCSGCHSDNWPACLSKANILTLTPSPPMKDEHAANPWAPMLSDTVLQMARTAKCFGAMNADPQVQCKLPCKGALAGTILKHACSVVEAILRTHGPAVFKIGFTSCPTSRFRNNRYGYAWDRQKWQEMMVVYCSHEWVGPAFLEASLILKYKGYSSAIKQLLYFLACF